MTRQIQTKKATRKRYSNEFKVDALALAEKAAAAMQLSLHESQLYGWRTRARLERDRSETERFRAAEIARLKRQLAEREEERAIAQNASVYFAKSLK